MSHTCDFLPLQLATLRKHVAGLSRVIVVQGPFGANPHTAGGDVAIVPQDGIEIINLDDRFVGHPFTIRVPMIIAFLLSRYIAVQDEEYAIIIHGDTIATRTVDPGELLNGSWIAGRGDSEDTILNTTWLAVNARKVPQIDVACRSMDQFQKDATIWDASDLDDSNAHTVGIESTAGYVNSLHFEVCLPCWLHLDRVVIRTKDAAEKVGVASSFLGIAPTEIVPCVHVDAEFHGIRIYQEASLAKKTEHPSITHRALSYATAVAKWIAAGSPRRSYEEVARIYDSVCVNCNRFSKKFGTCRICGCSVNKSKSALLNKIEMATERCPDGRW